MPRRGKPPASASRRDCPGCSAEERARREKRAEWQRSYRERDPAKGLYTLAKSRAKQTGVPFTITIDDVRAAYPADGKCPVLGLALTRGKGGKVLDTSPTLDRLNNQWGYEPGNIAVISYRANRAKGGLTARELEQIAQWMRGRGLD